MEDQRRDIGKGVWFGALVFYLLVFSVLGQSEPSMTLRVSPNMTVQQEGTTVSLLCQVSGLNTSTHFLSWVKEEPSAFLIVASKDLSVSNERYHVSFTEGAISTFNLTISPVESTDNGTYECNLIMQIDDTKSRGVLEEELDLLVYHRDAFPSCSPNGPAAITAGGPLSCLTSGNATPSINGKNDEWVYYSGVNGSGAVLSKTVTFSDNSQTYVCVAEIPGSDTRLSCTIGPLIVETTAVSSGLSAGEITGIVIGAIVLIIIIAVHTLCCRCNPRRWIHAKDYLINCGRSKETSQAHEDTYPPDILMRNEGDDVPPSYSCVLEDVSQSNRLRGESNVFAESTEATRKPDLNIAVRLDLNFAVAAANVSSKWKQPSDQEPSVGIPHKTQDDTNHPSATTIQNHNGIGAKSTLARAPDPPQQTPQIYAQVNKCRGNNTDTSGDISLTADMTEKTEQASRKPKKLSRRDEVTNEVESGSSKTVLYADLDLKKEGQDEIKQLRKPQETLYADIHM